MDHFTSHTDEAIAFQPWMVGKDAMLPIDVDSFVGFDTSKVDTPTAYDNPADWVPFSTYCSSSPSGSPYSSTDSRAFSDLHSATWTSTSPDLSLNYSTASSLPSPDDRCGSFDGTVMQSVEVAPYNSCSLSDVQHFAETDQDLNFFSDFSFNRAATYPAQLPLAFDAQYLPTYDRMGSHFSYESSPLPTQNMWPAVQQSRETTPSLEYLSIATPDRGRSVSRKHSHSISSSAAVNNANRIHKRERAVSTVSLAHSVSSSRRFSTPPVNAAQCLSRSCTPSRFSSRASPANSNFPCPLAPYGCTSSFGSKNEWKRHVNTQHLRLDLWRCDQCTDRETRPNDFNRKDLFIQHLRRMHHKPGSACAETTTSTPPRSARAYSVVGGVEGDADPQVAAAEQRCHIRLRQPPSHSCCLFCPAEFDGPGSWEERMEHVGRHLEQDKKEGRDALPVAEWRADSGFEQWLEVEGLIARVGYDWQMTDARRR